MPVRRKGSVLENLALISYIGISMMVPIFVSLYIGRWLDNRFNTQPIFLFIFIGMGVIAAFKNLYKVATKDIRNKKDKRK